MLKVPYKPLTLSLLVVGAILCAMAVMPPEGPAAPQTPDLVGTDIAFSPVIPLGDDQQSQETDQSPDNLASWFYGFVARRAAPVPSQSSPVASAAPTVVPRPQVTRDLSVIGPLVVNGEQRWALFDSQHNTSFTIGIGQSWANWILVAVTADSLEMKRGDTSYVVPIKK